MKLQKYHAILGYEPKILMVSHFAGFSTFDLFDLLILNWGAHFYIIPVCDFIGKFSTLVAFEIKFLYAFTNTLYQNLLHIHNLCQWTDINSIYSIWY